MRPVIFMFFLSLLIPVAGVAVEPERQQREFFETKIRPVLARECYSCHSVEARDKGKLRAGLMLDRRDGWLKGGDSGPAIIVGKPGESLLIKSMKHVKDVPEMPPAGPLPAGVINDFEKWIADGAVDPRTEAATAKSMAMTLEQAKTFWAFQPVKSVAAPPVGDAEWNASEIDRLIHAEQRRLKLKPAAVAEPRNLLRRVYFDLTGLPPTPEQIMAFEKDPSAYEKAVDELLGSRAFGERWARHWLDVARYAESNGKDRNIIWHDAWRYREYVIDAVDRDKPVDQFISEQIAGDLLPFSSPTQRDEQRIATGFLAMGPKAFEEPKAEVFRMDMIDEQIDLVSRTILGLSVACARCHDHKFDAIPTKDYYALAGIFRSTKTLYGEGQRGVANVPHSELQPIGPDAEKHGPAGLAYFQQLKDAQLAFNTSRSKRYGVVRRVADAKNQLLKPDADKPKLDADIARMEAEVKDWDAKIVVLGEELKKLEDTPPKMPGWAMAARDQPKPEECKVHIRGEVANLGPLVQRGTLQALTFAKPPEMPANGSGRLQLAEWLTHRDHPLTARVYVNRVWQHLFGQGLVSTPDDFGVNGSKPSNPALLDHLARSFIDSGWSQKKLIRSIVLSRAYRAATTPDSGNELIDADNIRLWRMSPRPLDAETVRDSILAVTGQFQAGPPNETALTKLHPRRDAEYFGFNPLFKPEQLEHRHRSVYLPVVRGVAPEFLKQFDGADPSRPVARRTESYLPSKALFLKNSPWMIEQAKQLVARVNREAATEETRVERVFRLLYGRSPVEPEKSLVREFLNDDGTSASDAQRPARWITLCQSLLSSTEFQVSP